jgi:hypothetical protein
MLESAVELVDGLCFAAVVLLIGFCAVGSMVAALRAVSRASASSPSHREAQSVQKH